MKAFDKKQYQKKPQSSLWRCKREVLFDVPVAKQTSHMKRAREDMYGKPSHSNGGNVKKSKKGTSSKSR